MNIKATRERVNLDVDIGSLLTKSLDLIEIGSCLRIEDDSESLNTPAASTIVPPEEVKKPTFVKKSDR